MGDDQVGPAAAHWTRHWPPTWSRAAGLRTGLGVLLVFVGLPPADAQPIYKSISPDGQITFSSTPPSHSAVAVERVELPPGPTPAEQAAAKARMQSLQEQVEASAERRRAPQQQATKRVEEAESAVLEARNALQQAQARDEPEDWQTIVTGGRVPSASYRNRIDEAEQRLQQAKQELQSARRAAR